MRSLLFLLLLPVYLLPRVVDPVPFEVDKRKMPVGTDFSKILPQKAGAYTLAKYEAPKPGEDGEATYTNGKKEVFMLFSLAETDSDKRETMKTIFEEVRNNPTHKAPLISLKTDPAYILAEGPTIAFFAWTRGKYCFSADAVGGSKETLDAFMRAFPY